MKFIKQDLLTLLIGLFLFASCKNSNSVGLDVDPAYAILGRLDSTELITSQTIQEQPVFTYQLARHPLGYLNDLLLGTTEANLAMQVNIPSASYSFGTSPILDSAVLVLSFSKQFYGDSTSIYNVNIHQLNESFGDVSTFKSDKTWVFNSTPIGTYLSSIKPNSTVQVSDIIKGKADTLKNVPAQIRIKLDKAFIENNIVREGATPFATNADFVSLFKGLYATTTITGSNKGGIMLFDFVNSNSNLELVYRNANTANAGGFDTTLVKYPINISAGPVVANIKHTYTSAVQANLTASTQQTKTFIQPLVGLKTKITFPGIKNFKAKIGASKIVVNKAELVINVDKTSLDNVFTAAPRLSLYRNDIAEQPMNVPDNNAPSQVNQGDSRALSPAAFGGYFDSLKSRYVFVVTSYMQDLIDGKTEDYGTFLAPTSLSEYEIRPSVSSAARTVIGSGSNPSAKIKLNVYYTKVN